MRAVLTRVTSASVSIGGETVGKIGKGFLILLGVGPNDTEKECRYLAEKCLGLRIFEDENGKMNLGLDAVGGEVLVVSQFTLYGNCRKGRRPSFTEAANPELGNALYEKFLAICAELGYPPQHGRFGADMQVASVNDGEIKCHCEPVRTLAWQSPEVFAMLQIHTLPLGDYQTNCYLLCEGSRCVIVDPGYEPETVLAFLKAKGLIAEAILLTHGHFDHVGGVKAIAAELGFPVYLHAAENTMPPMMTAGTLYYTHTYDEGDCLSLAGLTIRVLHTPGHTPGSVCFICEDALISGDTLFAGACGRTDLPGGSWTTIKESLHRLAALENDYTVYPGHGESTTLSREKRYNPYLR